MKNVAILITVYNRKDTTISGLYQLYRAINYFSIYNFDIYMTNDGCTDGTEKKVKELFPEVNIINHSGNLFWSQGMNLAWNIANKNKIYDFFLWFNDDALLFEEALEIIFEPLKEYNNRTIISGCFIDNKGKTSYGGRDKYNIIISPSPNYPEIYLMNGNLVLIPKEVFEELGYIDTKFQHGLGDWDYGLRAQERNIKVKLTSKYVGITDRHDFDIEPYWDNKRSLKNRIVSLYSPKYSVLNAFYFQKKHFGIIFAIKKLCITHIYTLFPSIHKIRKIKNNEQ